VSAHHQAAAATDLRDVFGRYPASRDVGVVDHRPNVLAVRPGRRNVGDLTGDELLNLGERCLHITNLVAQHELRPPDRRRDIGRHLFGQLGDHLTCSYL
jgi:hypothetical protein